MSEAEGWVNLLFPGWQLVAILLGIFIIGIVVVFFAIAVGLSRQNKMNEERQEHGKK